MGITDGTMICSLCGEWKTGCSLCGQAPLIKGSSSEISFMDDKEIEQQSRAIRREAEKRRNEQW